MRPEHCISLHRAAAVDCLFNLFLLVPEPAVIARCRQCDLDAASCQENVAFKNLLTATKVATSGGQCNCRLLYVMVVARMLY